MSQPFVVSALLLLAFSSFLLTGFCVYSHRSLKKQLEQMVFDGEKAASLSESLAEAGKQFEKVCALVDEMEKSRNVSSEAFPAPVSASTSPSRHNQVMRLHRSGESVASIASALGVSQGEVKLTLKVQEALGSKISGGRS